MTPLHARAKLAIVGSILWILCVQYFVAEQICRVAWTIPYSMRRNFISDLGAVQCGVGADAVCSPLHLLMNSSFILQGVLIFLGTILVRRLFPNGALTNVSLVMIALSGLGICAVGLAPEDVKSSIHYAAAAEHFLLDNLGMALLGISLLRYRHWPRAFALYTLVSGAIGFGATVLLSKKIFLGLNVGGMERVAAYPFTLWLTITGCFLLLRLRHSQ